MKILHNQTVFVISTLCSETKDYERQPFYERGANFKKRCEPMFYGLWMLYLSKSSCEGFLNCAFGYMLSVATCHYERQVLSFTGHYLV